MTPRNTYSNTETNFQIRLIVKGMLCGALMMGLAVWFAIRHSEYAAAIGTANTVLLGTALLLLPFFLLGLHRDITDSSWERYIVSIESCTLRNTAWVVGNVAPAKRTHPVRFSARAENHLRLVIRMDNGKTRTMVVPASRYSKFSTGDRVVHLCGEKNGLSHAEEKES